jgi:hypothetical protein
MASIVGASPEVADRQRGRPGYLMWMPEIAREITSR